MLSAVVLNLDGDGIGLCSSKQAKDGVAHARDARFGELAVWIDGSGLPVAAAFCSLATRDLAGLVPIVQDGSMSCFTTRDGCRLAYEIEGRGPLVVLTPGGREGRAGIRSLTHAVLAQGFTVLTWDRRNGGESDVFFGGEPMVEAEIWAEDLADLIAHLGLGPAWIAGGSGGCRTSVITALRRPEAAKGLICWSASGGEFASQFLGFQYHVPYVMAALRGGMQAVAEGPYWSDRILANPANRERMLALDPQDFIATMKRWMSAFAHRPDSMLIGATDAQLATIGVPTLIFAGHDDVHPRAVSDAMAHFIPDAAYRPSPWSDEDFVGRFSGRVAQPVMDLYPALAPEIAAFIRGYE